MNTAKLVVKLLAATGMLTAQSFTGTLNPADANDVFLVTFNLSAPTTLRVQS